MAGFDNVALSNYGTYGSLQFENHQLKDQKDSIITKLENEEFDCSLIMGSDPISHLPQRISSKLAKNPIILIDNKKSATYHLADVVLPSAITGIEVEGLAYRFDQIPMTLKKIVNPPSNLPSDEDLLIQIITKLKSKGGG